MDSGHFVFLSLIFSITLCVFPPETSAIATISGYLTVNATTGSTIFYAFYEAQHPKSSLSKTPLLVWVQGGPGCSSMIGNFYELGPWCVASQFVGVVERLSLEVNPGSWNRLFGLLFLDNPIGVGFNIASTPQEIPRNQQDVTNHLFIALSSFIGLGPFVPVPPIFVTGESYAGKYVLAVCYHIMTKNAQLPRSRKVNLVGVVIGKGLTDPATQMATHAAQCYYLGLINGRQREELEKIQADAIVQIEKGNWHKATTARRRLMDMLMKMTGLATLNDFRRDNEYDYGLVVRFLRDWHVKRALGANESILFDACSGEVRKALYDDVMKSVKDNVEFLLVEKKKVLLYQGIYDLKDGVFSNEAWVRRLNGWDRIGDFLKAERKVWKVEGKIAGYVRRWGCLSNVVLLEAGHLVPADQPLNSQAMTEDWVLDKGLFSDHRPCVEL